MCVLCHPGPLQRFEIYGSVQLGLARQTWYAQNNDPHWRVHYDCGGNQLGFFTAALMNSLAGDPPNGPAGAGKWVPLYLAANGAQ